MTNVADWIENNVTEQLNAWITLNQETPLYIGAVQAPMMALFYDRYDNIDGLSSLNWTHVTNLGVADHIAPELLASVCRERERARAWVKRLFVLTICVVWL